MKLTNLPYALLVFISLSKLICADEKKDTLLPLAQAVEEVYPAIVRIEVVSEQGFKWTDDEVSGNRKWSDRFRGWSGCDQSSCGRQSNSDYLAVCMTVRK
jgi:hypothetical protein